VLTRLSATGRITGLVMVGLAFASGVHAQREDATLEAPSELPETTGDALAEGDIASSKAHLAGRRGLEGEGYLDLQLYAWVPLQVTGDSTVQGVTVDLDLGPDEIFDLFNGAISFRTEVWRRDVGLFADFQYVKLGQDTDKVKIEIENYVFDFGAMWRAARVPLSGEPGGPGLVVDLYGGGRVQHLDVDIKIGPISPPPGAGPGPGPGPGGGPTLGPFNASGEQTWISPLLGARFAAVLSDDWAIVLRGDVGGFGVNDDRDLNWSVLLGARWQFAENWDLRFGYRAFGSEYLDGQDTPDAFGQDLILHGPYLGVAFSF
jgi:hypothetical protein